MTSIADWLRPVQEFVRIWQSFPEQQIPSGASPEQLESLKAAGQKRGLHVPDQYLEFLRFVNGTSFDGLNFAGWNGTAEGSGSFLNLNDPVNDAFNGDVTIYGISNGVLYAYSASARRYQILDGTEPSAEFGTFGEMIEDVFSYEVSLLRETLNSA